MRLVIHYMLVYFTFHLFTLQKKSNIFSIYLLSYIPTRQKSINLNIYLYQFISTRFNSLQSEVLYLSFLQPSNLSNLTKLPTTQQTIHSNEGTTLNYAPFHDRQHPRITQCHASSPAPPHLTPPSPPLPPPQHHPPTIAPRSTKQYPPPQSSSANPWNHSTATPTATALRTADGGRRVFILWLRIMGVCPPLPFPFPETRGFPGPTELLGLR